MSLYVTARIRLHQTKVDVQRRLSGINRALKRQWLKQSGKNPPKMKRRRCAICGKWNHKTEECFVLTRHKNDNEMTTIVPVGTTVNHVNGGGTMEDNGQDEAMYINGD
jgi:hypothetical protein